MPLGSGTRLGPYEILALIGAGGMGEVYEARDIRLDRTVAIKVLLGDISAHPDRRARFEREAKSIAALTHPHICTLHDVGAHSGTMFLVMERLKGETLARRLEKGRLPTEQALTIAVQIADALATAHRQGIIHRDLKPANVMLTKSGAKLLDFGLAKLRGHAEQPAAAQLVSATTRSASLTAEGVIVGTLHYMAPEQLQGGPTDARTDLWALGAICYEMLSGKRAFDGNSAASVIGSILEREPPSLVTIDPVTPPVLDRIIRRCLEKEPDLRFQSAHDLAFALQAVAEGRAGVGGAGAAIPAVGGVRNQVRWKAVAAAFVVLAAALLGFVIGRRSVPPTGPATGVVRFTVVANAQIPELSSYSTVATSADGRLLVFSGNIAGTATLFLRKTDSDSVTPIHGTEGALAPFVSPDGRWVAFFRTGKLLKVPIEGGPAQAIAEAPSGRGGVWRRDGTIFFAPSYAGPIVEVPAEGGVPRPVTTLDVKGRENSHRYPELADDDVLLFTVRHESGLVDAHEIAAIRLSTREQRTLVRGGVHAYHLSTGHLVFSRANTLMAVSFDARSLQAKGAPVAVLDGVDYRWIGALSDFAVSSNGTLVYRPFSIQQAELARVQRDGSAETLPVTRDRFRAVRLSPDGRSAVVQIDQSDRTGLDVVDLARGTRRPLRRGYRDETPFWSPDGTRIFFSSTTSAGMGLFWIPAHSGGEARELRSAGQWRFVTSITRDSRMVIYGNVSPQTDWDVWIQPIDSTTDGRPLLGAPGRQLSASLSPDGRTLVYVSNESGRYEVHAATYPSLSRRVQISTMGGTEPVWAHSGRELFYRSEDALMNVRIDSAGLTAAAPVLLFRAPLITTNELCASYDVLPDDRSFVIIRAAEGAANSYINVIQNWLEELKAKVPAK